MFLVHVYLIPGPLAVDSDECQPLGFQDSLHLQEPTFLVIINMSKDRTAVDQVQCVISKGQVGKDGILKTKDRLRQVLANPLDVDVVDISSIQHCLCLLYGKMSQYSPRRTS